MLISHPRSAQRLADENDDHSLVALETHPALTRAPFFFPTNYDEQPFVRSQQTRIGRHEQHQQKPSPFLTPNNV
ncbi:hypothetical protein V2G26_008950 [Clonostachys chloroleuca]